MITALKIVPQVVLSIHYGLMLNALILQYFVLFLISPVNCELKKI